MTSELKSATSRANGAKSRGPKTAEGRETSSHNSFKHGFTAKKTIVLECENKEQFQEVLGYYTVTYQPGSAVEEDLVSEMVACRWRMQRLRLIETALIDSEMDRDLPDVETPEDPGYQLASHFAAWWTSRAPFRSPLATNHVSIAFTNVPTVRSANCNNSEKSRSLTQHPPPTNPTHPHPTWTDPERSGARPQPLYILPVRVQ